MKGLKKKIIFSMVGITGLFLILIVSAIIFLHTNTFKNITLRVVNKNIPGQISIDELNLNIFAGSIHANDIKIVSPEGKNLGQIAGFTFDLSWRKLLEKDLSISMIEINSLRFDLEQSENGELNLISAFILPDQKPDHKPDKKHGSSALPFNISVDQLIINDASINFIKRDQKLDIALSNIDILLTEFNFSEQSAMIRSEIQKAIIKHQKESIIISPFQVKARVSKESISDFLLQTRINDFNIEASAKGSLGNPDATINITPVSGKTKIKLIDTIALECSLKNKVLTILTPDFKSVAESEQQPGTEELFIDGKIDMAQAFPHGFLDSKRNLNKLDYKLNLRMDHTDLSSLPGLKDNFKGVVSAIVNLQGLGIDPETATADIKIDIKADQLVSEQIIEPVDVQLKISASFEDALAKIRTFKIETPGALLTGNASLNTRFDKALMDIAGQINLEIVDPLLLKQLTGKPGRGNLSIKGEVKGNTKLFNGFINITGDTLELDGQTMDQVTADILFQDQTIDIRQIMIQVVEGSRIFVKGKIFPLDKLGKSFDLNITSPNFDLFCINSIKQNIGKQGLLSLDVTLIGKMDQSDQITASADITNFIMSLDNKPFINIKGAKASYEHGVLGLSDFRIDLAQRGSKEERGSLTIAGEGSLDNALNFTMDGRIPASMINPIVKEVNSAIGWINIAASLKGSVKNPVANVDVSFADLSITLENLEQELKNISGKIALTPHKLEIIDFKGMLDKGKFNLGGRLELEEFVPGDFDFTFNAHNLFLDIPDTMELTFNSILNFSGTLKESKFEKSSLTGEVVLLGGLYYKDVNMSLIDLATKKSRKVSPVKVKQENSMLENISLNISIKQRQPLLVDNNLADLTINPDMVIQGTADNPAITGRAQIDSGVVYFQKAEFDVIKGVVDFTNPYKIEPNIDIKAITDIRTWAITLMISGTPDNLNFELSSDPKEQHADIISLIMLGKTRQEMGQSSSDKNSLNADNMASNFVADQLGKTLKDVTGLDKLEIKQESNSNSGTRDIHVSVGTNLSRQMSVSYDVKVENGETIQRITTDYKILENLLMSGFQESDGNFGGNIKYRLEFR